MHIAHGCKNFGPPTKQQQPIQASEFRAFLYNLDFYIDWLVGSILLDRPQQLDTPSRNPRQDAALRASNPQAEFRAFFI